MSDANERKAAQGYEHTPGVEKGTEGTVLDPRMGGDPVTPEDINPGPTARGSRSAAEQGTAAGASDDATRSGDRPFDPGRAYTGSDVDPGEIGGVGGVPGGIGVPARDVSRGLSGTATGGLAGGTAASPGSGSAGGIGGSTAGASQMQTVAGGGAIPGAEADIRGDAGGRFGSHAASPGSRGGIGDATGTGTDDRDVSASTGGHGGLGAGVDQDANVGAPDPFRGTSGMAPHDEPDAVGH